MVFQEDSPGSEHAKRSTGWDSGGWFFASCLLYPLCTLVYPGFLLESPLHSIPTVLACPQRTCNLSFLFALLFFSFFFFLFFSLVAPGLFILRVCLPALWEEGKYYKSIKNIHISIIIKFKFCLNENHREKWDKELNKDVSDLPRGFS